MQTRAIARRMARLAAVIVLTAMAPSALAQAPPAAAPVPPAVRKAFEQAFPGATVSAATQQRDGSRTVFRVEGLDKGRRRSVLYDANATVVETAEQVDENDLPAPVAAAMHSHPRAIYGTGMKVTRGASVEYHLTVRGTRKTAMIAKPDGTVVSFK